MGVSRQLKCLAHNMYAAHKKRMKERLRENPSSSFRFVHSLFFSFVVFQARYSRYKRKCSHSDFFQLFYLLRAFLCLCFGIFSFFPLSPFDLIFSPNISDLRKKGDFFLIFFLEIRPPCVCVLCCLGVFRSSLKRYAKIKRTA